MFHCESNEYKGNLIISTDFIIYLYNYVYLGLSLAVDYVSLELNRVNVYHVYVVCKTNNFCIFLDFQIPNMVKNIHHFTGCTFVADLYVVVWVKEWFQ